jgi:hypothetical protein
MSIHRIPDRYLNTTIHIFRENTTIDSIGDYATSQDLAYASLKANVQPKLSEAVFEINGIIHRQDHVAYINRVEDSVIRDIHINDIALDEETRIRYRILGVENWQAANPSITDSHHIKIILKSTTNSLKEQLEVQSLTSKGKIA